MRRRIRSAVAAQAFGQDTECLSSAASENSETSQLFHSARQGTRSDNAPPGYLIHARILATDKMHHYHIPRLQYGATYCFKMPSSLEGMMPGPDSFSISDRFSIWGLLMAHDLPSHIAESLRDTRTMTASTDWIANLILYRKASLVLSDFLPARCKSIRDTIVSVPEESMPAPSR